MPEHPDLDDRIRDLLASAVADSPPAPDLDRSGVALDSDGDGHRRWMLGAATGLSIAAALVALFAYARPADIAEPIVPATIVPATDVPTVTEPERSATSTPDSEPSQPAATMESEPTSVPRSEPSISGPAAPLAAVTAGPDGVTIVSGADTTYVTDEAMTVAFVADRRVFMQRSTDLFDESADSPILVADGSSGEPAAVELPEEVAAPMRLHDVADVDGEVVLLVETRPSPCTIERCNGALWAVRPDSGSADVLTSMSVWESGWSGLTLGANGLAVGTRLSGPELEPFSISVNGGEPIDFDRFGLGTSSDCSTCPTAFASDRTGRFLSWIEVDLDSGRHTVTVAAIDGSASIRVPLIDEAGQECCVNQVDLPLPTSWPRLGAITMSPGGSAITGRLVLNHDPTHGGPESATVNLATGIVTRGESGVTTSFG
jgi:hypothetical protein